MKILIFGLPGSGKSTLAEPLAQLLGGVWINSDDVRSEYDDRDFSLSGRIRQAERMKYLADGVILAERIAVADFVCPTRETRSIFKPDFTVWMDTVTSCEYEDTLAMFEPPERVDYHVSAWFNDTHAELCRVVNNYMLRLKNQPTVRL